MALILKVHDGPHLWRAPDVGEQATCIHCGAMWPGKWSTCNGRTLGGWPWGG